MSRSRISPALLLVFPIASGLFSCSEAVHHHVYSLGYGTTWDIHLYEGSLQDANEISSYIQSTSKLLDIDENGGSGSLYALNHEQSTPLHPFVIEAYELSATLATQTEGAYSYALGALKDAWLNELEQGRTLNADTREALLSQAKDTHVEVDGQMYSKVGQGIIDLGAIGKGLCMRHIHEMLGEKGIARYFINGGSSALLFGDSGQGDGSVRVRLNDAPSYSFKAKNAAVSCSSVSRQKYAIDGKAYSHILNPYTGIAHVEYDAAVLLGNDPALCDGYSTVAMVLGEPFLKKIEAEGIRGALIKDETIVYESEGFLSK